MVLFGVVLGGLVTMLFSVGQVRVGNVRMVRGAKVIAGFMVLGGFRVVVCGQSVVMSGLLVMLRCLLGHLGNLHFRSQTWNQVSASMLQIFIPAQYVMGYGAFK